MKKRRKDHPAFPVKPGRRRKLGQPSKLSARARAALERTKKGRADLDAAMAGADLSGLEAYPVVFFPLGVTPKPPGLKRIGVSKDEEDEEPELEPPVIERPPIAPPVPFERNDALATRSKPPAPTKLRDYHCNECGFNGHNRGRCPDLVPLEEWARIDEIVATSTSIRAAAKRLGIEVTTLRARLRVRQEVENIRALRAQRSRTVTAVETDAA